MMGRIFLGKWWHWVTLVAITGGLWLAGSRGMHVIEFNTFILGLLAIVTTVILVLLAGTRPGEQATRDAIGPRDNGGG